MDNKYLVLFKTVQANVIKGLVEDLKDLITEANFEFDKNGWRIVTIDNSHTVLVHLRLEHDKFEQYDIKADKVVAGVSMLNLFRLTKTITSNDTICIYIDSNKNYLHLIRENSEKNEVTELKLKLIDLNEQDITIPKAEFSSVITMPSTDFQKICKDMNAFSDEIEIKSVGNKVIFSCSGDFASQETVISEKNSGMCFKVNNNEIVQGVFSLKYLVLFTKCANLSNSIELFLKNDYPLIIQYQVASLGSLKLCLAPNISTSE